MTRRRGAIDGGARRIAGVSERLLLVIGVTLFTLVAAARIIATCGGSIRSDSSPRISRVGQWRARRRKA